MYPDIDQIITREQLVNWEINKISSCIVDEYKEECVKLLKCLRQELLVLQELKELHKLM